MIRVEIQKLESTKLDSAAKYACTFAFAFVQFSFKIIAKPFWFLFNPTPARFLQHLIAINSNFQTKNLI